MKNLLLIALFSFSTSALANQTEVNLGLGTIAHSLAASLQPQETITSDINILRVRTGNGSRAYQMVLTFEKENHLLESFSCTSYLYPMITVEYPEFGESLRKVEAGDCKKLN